MSGQPLAIVKVQVALATNLAGPKPMLVYDEGRARMVETRDPVLAQAMAGQPYPYSIKNFFWAFWNGSSWVLDLERGSAPWQEW